MAEKIKINTKFGEIAICYAMLDTDGTNLEEGYDVYDEDDDHVGEIGYGLFHTDILEQDPTDLDEDVCNLREYNEEIAKLEEAVSFLF